MSAGQFCNATSQRVEGAYMDTKGLARATAAVSLHEMNDCADFPANGCELALPAELVRSVTASTACNKVDHPHPLYPRSVIT